MKLQEYVPLAPLTTLGVGGAARFFIEAHTEKDIGEAVLFARERNLPIFPLGKGSNVLVPDTGIEGVVLKMAMQDIVTEDDGERLLFIADAGGLWDAVVDRAGEHGVFGIENLAGIPGTVGGAAIQNIGAYGAELSRVFAYADVVHAATGRSERIEREDAALAYRTSLFKHERDYIIARVALTLMKRGEPDTSYADLARARAEGAALATPIDLARAVRSIRAKKFPHGDAGGTAGSFFKNPVVSREAFGALEGRFPGLPAFPQGNGTVKISLAWLLDHALSLKGFSRGAVRLYEKQPLVIVARPGALAVEIDAFAREIRERVREATGILIEREVETFGARG